MTVKALYLGTDLPDRGVVQAVSGEYYSFLLSPYRHLEESDLSPLPDWHEDLDPAPEYCLIPYGLRLEDEEEISQERLLKYGYSGDPVHVDRRPADMEPVRTTYTVEEAAVVLHVNQDTVRRYIRDGRIKAASPGGRKYVIPASEVQRVLYTAMDDAEAEAVEIYRDLDEDGQRLALDQLRALRRIYGDHKEDEE